MTVLVVGATGQLGTATVRKLVAGGSRVRALVRPTSDYAHLAGAVELAHGDLGDLDSLDRACAGAEAIIATANACVPRRGDSFLRDEAGYDNLIRVAERRAIPQLIFVSVPVTAWDKEVPTFHTKRLIEQRLFASRVPYTIFRISLFMDVYLTFVGSTLPLRGAEQPTMRRQFWFSRLQLAALGSSVERLGVALIPGDGRQRHSFIAVDDVAAFLAGSVGETRAVNAIFDLGGPAALSWHDVAKIYAGLLRRRVRRLHLSVPALQALQSSLEPVSPGAANQLGLVWITGRAELTCDNTTAVELFGVSPIGVEEFLRRKLACPA